MINLDLRYLEQNFGTHAEKAIDDPECEDHWHTIDEPEKRTGSHQLANAPGYDGKTHKLKNQGSEATDNCTSTC